MHCLAPSQKCYRNPTGFTQVGPRFGVCESSVLTNGEPVCLVCLSVHHENIGMFVTHDFKAHSPPPPAQRNTRTGSVAAGLEMILKPIFLCSFPPPGQRREYSSDKRRFRGSIKAEMRRFFAKN